MQQKMNRWLARAVAEALGISGGQVGDVRCEMARTDTTKGMWYDADGWCDRWTRRQLKLFSIVFSIRIPAIHSLNSPIQIQV